MSMRKKTIAWLLALILLAAFVPAQLSFAATPPLGQTGTGEGVYIVEYYGHGNSTSANAYKNGYILLYNSSSVKVDFNNTWSIQYMAATAVAATAPNTVLLPGSIEAGGYYLITTSEGTNPPRELPLVSGVDIPGTSCTISVQSGTTGLKIALVKSAASLTALTNTNILTNANIVDFVGNTQTSGAGILHLGSGQAPTGTATQPVTRVQTAGVFSTEWDNGLDWTTPGSGAYPVLHELALLYGKVDGNIATWNFKSGFALTDPGESLNINQNRPISLEAPRSGSVMGGSSNPRYGGTGWHYEGKTTDADKGFYFSFYTTGYKQIAISFEAENSPTGPRYLQAQVKVGGTWTDVPGALLDVCDANGSVLTKTMINLPSAWNSGVPVEMRIIRVATAARDGRTIPAGGSCYIKDLKITGRKMWPLEVLGAAPGVITADLDPLDGPVPQGTQVTLTCSTPAAKICYKVGPRDYVIADNPVTLTLYNNMTITAHGFIEGNGNYNGDTARFQYTIDNVTEPPTWTPNGTGPVVIEEVYGHGGNKGSVYLNPFVVLRNISDSPVNLSGWSLMVASSKGTFTSTASNCYTFGGVTIRPNGYLLVRLKHTGGVEQQLGTFELEDFDVNAENVTIGSGSGKVALVKNASTCSGSNDPNLVDLVGWGGANDYLGNGTAPGTSRDTNGKIANNDVTNGIMRAKSAIGDGEIDLYSGSYTGDNAEDFIFTWPKPRNKYSAGSPAEEVLPVTCAQGNVLMTGTSLVLDCETPDVEIWYSVNTNLNNAHAFGPYQLYTGPINTAAWGGVSIRAYASKEIGGNEIRSERMQRSFAFVAPGGTYSVWHARWLIGHTVTVEGVVTFIESNANGSVITFTMQDETELRCTGSCSCTCHSRNFDYQDSCGCTCTTCAVLGCVVTPAAGISVTGPAKDFEGIAVGKKLKVTGERVNVRGLEQIQKAKMIGTSTLVGMPEPIVATASELVNPDTAEALESMYVQVKNARMDTIRYDPGYGGTPPATGIIDNTGAVNIHYIPILDTDKVDKGDIVNVLGVLSQYASDRVVLRDGYFLRVYEADWITRVERPVVPLNEWTLAAWNQGAGKGKQMLASDGEYSWCSVVTNGDAKGASYEFKASKSSIVSDNWDKAGRYVQFELCTKGFTDIKLSAMLRSSGAGPRNFYMQYSLNGVDFFEIPESVFELNYNALNDVLMQRLYRFELPEIMQDQDVVFLRWVLADGNRADGTGKIASGGNFNFTGVKFTGMEKVGLTVEATPPASAVPLDQLVTLAAIQKAPFTADKIYYRQYIAPEGEDVDPIHRGKDDFIEYTGAPIVLDNLPYVLQAYVSGTDGGGFPVDGRICTFYYEQAKCGAVRSTSYSGALRANRDVTLSSVTEGATIHATVIRNYGMPNESAPELLTGEGKLTLRFAEEEFPVQVVAQATKDKYLPSEVLTLDFTLRVTGGEKHYFGQIHSHTALSDGTGSIEDAFNYAKNTAKQIDFLIVTDHSHYFDTSANLGTLDGKNTGAPFSYMNSENELVTTTKWDYAHAAAKAATESSYVPAVGTTPGHYTFVADYGYEMTWAGQYGHINTYATEGFLSRNDPKYTISGGQGLRNYYNSLAEFPQSISMFNHPGSTFGTFDDFAYYTETYDEVMQLIEVGNGAGAVRSSAHWPSYDQYTRALDKGWHLAPANNQDNHQGKWGDANTARNVIWTNDFTKNGVLQAMRERCFYATEDNNLEITYTINGEPMGTIFDSKPEGTLKFHVTVYDPDPADRNFKMSVIANNGREVYSRSGVVPPSTDRTPAVFEFELPSTYSYYYVRIDQADNDIAVTAPIWVGKVLKIDASLTTTTKLPVVGENMNLKTVISNNEPQNFIATRISYYVNGTQIQSTPVSWTISPNGGSREDNIVYKPTYSGKLELKVIVEGRMQDGTACEASGILLVNALDPADVLNVALDASHSNYYVTGANANKYKQLERLVDNFNGRLTLITGGITEAKLAGINLLILTAPGGSSTFDGDELTAIANYAKAGGNIAVMGKGDENESATSANNKLNGVLEKVLGKDMGSRLREDTIIDLTYAQKKSFEVSLFGDDSFSYTTRFSQADKEKNDIHYLFSARFLAEAKDESTGVFDHFSGSSVDAAAGATKLVAGTSATKGIKFTNLNTTAPYLPKSSSGPFTAEGDKATYVSVEKIANGGGWLLISGSVFWNDDRVAAPESSHTDWGVNYFLTRNMITSAMKLTSIADVRTAANAATRWFAIEGTVTTNAEAFDRNTAFFDSIYVQDDTGGINLFPVSGNVSIGERVWVCGFTGAYQGDNQMNDVQLHIQDSKQNPLFLKDTAKNPDVRSARYVTTQRSMWKENQGWLVYIEGEVTEVVLNEGVVELIYVTDKSGVSRVFLDGYIYCDCPGCAKNATGHDLTWVKKGSIVRVIGIASTGMHPGPDGSDIILPRLRIRNRAEIIKIDSYKPNDPEPELIDKLRGDANCDGRVNAADAAAILRHLVQLKLLTEQGEINALVTDIVPPYNTKVSAADAARILRFLVQLIPPPL